MKNISQRYCVSLAWGPHPITLAAIYTTAAIYTSLYESPLIVNPR